MKKELERFQTLIENHEEIDALLASSMINIFYTSSFEGESEHSHEAYVLLSPDKCTFFTYPMYEQKAKSILPAGLELVIVKEKKDFYDHLERLCGSGARIGFEATNLTYQRFAKLQDNLPDLELVPTEGIIEKFRATKQTYEIEKISRAAKITDLTLKEVLPKIRIGMKEIELVELIENSFKDHGAQGRAFETIVASGKNSSQPHYKPDTRPITEGPLLIDMGARFENYNSDLSRTFFIGDPAKKKLKSIYKKFEETYNLVLKAQKKAIESMKPGKKLERVWDAAYDEFKSASQEEHFIHGLGHGVGLEIHENPSLRKKDDTEKKALETETLEKNMIITVEPGLYYPEWGGVRIEDLCLVNENGVELLSNFPKEITILSLS
jgi:Xaa-Pro aminopeptidase